MLKIPNQKLGYPTKKLRIFKKKNKWITKFKFRVVTTQRPMLLIDELLNIKKLKSATAIVNVKKDSFVQAFSVNQ